MTTNINRFSFPIESPIVCKTNGKGLWSKAVRTITVRRIELDHFDLGLDGDLYVSFRVYFTKKDWNIHKHGLIYTDDSFIRDLRNGMNKMPQFDGVFTTRGDAAVDYTEQGQQGDNYVSVEVLLKGKRMNDFLMQLGKHAPHACEHLRRRRNALRDAELRISGF